MTVERIEKTSKDVDLADAVEAKVQMLLNEGSKATMELEYIKPVLPPFYDAEKYRLGQQAFYKNSFCMMIAKLSGLLSLLSIPTILNVLMFTKQSGTICGAFRRYVSTILHTLVWYEKTPEDDQFLESLKIVRQKHCAAFRRIYDVGYQRTSQLDMALTQFGFLGFTLLRGDYLGVDVTQEELEGLVHIWHVVGNMLGMDEKYNICAGGVEEARAISRRLLEEVFLPSLTKKEKNFEIMSRTLIEGMWSMNPYLDTDAFLSFTLQLASSAATNNNHSIHIDTSSMSLYSRFILNTQLFLHEYLLPSTYRWSSFFRAYFNSQIRLSIFLIENFPFLAYWCFGKKRAHVEIYK